VLREFAKIGTLILSILSLYALLASAFFVPGSPWQARLLSSVETLAMSACVCFASGLLFSLTTRSEPPVTRTLPVQLFWWTVGGAVLMLLLSRYLEVYYIPMIWKNQPW
jgi:hypothetical protein